VRATLGGEREAFDQLVERYQGKIYNVALSITGRREDALDATQNAFLNAYDKLDRFDSEYRFFSWIYRIGLNESLRLVRDRKEGSVPETGLPSPQAGPESTVRGREAGRVIRRALMQLSPDLRAVIVLRHFHGLSYAEMAAVIGVPAKTVKSRLFSARQQLRRSLTEEGLAPGGER
jgi:RNA polymerase sigma-70 factor (ECF subfamily)